MISSSRTNRTRWLVAAALLLSLPLAWAAAPTGKFTAGTGFVVDNQTGLTWQHPTSGGQMSYVAAQTACGDLVLDGKDDWRLPTLQELYSLVDFNVVGLAAYIDATAFPGTSFGQHWTATQAPSKLASSDRFAVAFNSNYGPVHNTLSISFSSAYVRCVR